MIEYRIGDATNPDLPGRLAIVHVCNDVGAFGAGFAAAVARRHPLAKSRFELWARGDDASGTMREYRMGAVQWVGVGADLGHRLRWAERWVVNMVAQHGLRSERNPVPLRLSALEECLRHVAGQSAGLTVVMPRIGCRLAGGRWADVEPVVVKTLGKAGVPVVVFDLPGA